MAQAGRLRGQAGSAVLEPAYRRIVPGAVGVGAPGRVLLGEAAQRGEQGVAEDGGDDDAFETAVEGGAAQDGGQVSGGDLLGGPRVGGGQGEQGVRTQVAPGGPGTGEPLAGGAGP